jgi:hypothetical protein
LKNGTLMLKWPLLTLLAVGLAAGVAAASSPLSGTYRTTITGKPAPLNGKWQLRFLPGNAVRVVRNGKIVVFGRAIVTGSRVRVSDRSGPYACSSAEGAGVYLYSVVGRRLTFKVVADRCVGRKFILTTKPYVK